MGMVAKCPFCRSTLPFRRDKRGGRYFRCNQCQMAFFFSGSSVIDRLDSGGSWSFSVENEPSPHGMLDVLEGK